MHGRFLDCHGGRAKTIMAERSVGCWFCRADGPSHTSLEQRPRSRAVMRFEGCKPGPCNGMLDLRRFILRACSPQSHGCDRYPWRCHGLVCCRALGTEECQVVFRNSSLRFRKYSAWLRKSDVRVRLPYLTIRRRFDRTRHGRERWRCRRRADRCCHGRADGCRYRRADGCRHGWAGGRGFGWDC